MLRLALGFCFLVVVVTLAARVVAELLMFWGFLPSGNGLLREMIRLQYLHRTASPEDISQYIWSRMTILPDSSLD